MTRSERLFNIIAALSVFSWGAFGLLATRTENGGVTVRLCVVFLHCCVGFLFLCRSPLKTNASCKQLGWVLLSFVSGAIPWKLAPPPGDWPIQAEVPFVIGTLLAAISLICLGRSFAVLPAVRDIVVQGPYRLVRHPAYVGELLMVSSCCVALVWWGSILALLASIAAVVLRIHIEESLLINTHAYAAYTTSVRWRLVPRVW